MGETVISWLPLRLPHGRHHTDDTQTCPPTLSLLRMRPICLSSSFGLEGSSWPWPSSRSLVRWPRDGGQWMPFLCCPSALIQVTGICQKGICILIWYPSFLAAAQGTPWIIWPWWPDGFRLAVPQYCIYLHTLKAAS